MPRNLWIAAREWKPAQKEHPHTNREVLAIVTDPDDTMQEFYEIVTYDARDRQYYNPSFDKVHCKYWCELPAKPQVIKPASITTSIN